MGSRTISVDDEAYALLRAAKMEGESFSDVVKRTLAPGRPRLAALSGLLGDKDGAKLDRAIRDMRAKASKAGRARRARQWERS